MWINGTSVAQGLHKDGWDQTKLGVEINQRGLLDIWEKSTKNSKGKWKEEGCMVTLSDWIEVSEKSN